MPNLGTMWWKFPRLILIFSLGSILFLGGCKIGFRSLRYNKPSLDDYKLWEEAPVQRSGNVSVWQDGRASGIPPLKNWAQGRWYKQGMSKADFFQKTGTASFLVWRDDSLLYEYYAPKYNAETRFNSFSMAKPYVATLIGIAIGEGYIQSIDQSVGDFLPEFNDSTRCALKIRHLLQMTSGIQSSDGNLNLWGTTARLYYGDSAEDLISGIRFRYPPGTRWAYKNINIQLLGMVLASATGRSVSEYLEEKIWAPLGMEGDASWSTYEDGTEKAFCCLNARTRDFARFGILWLNRGKWEDQQLIPETWIQQSTDLDTAEASRQRYQYCLYTTVEQEDYYLEGLLGQFTYICPSTRTVIVRTGNKINPNVPWYDMFKVLAKVADKPSPVPLPAEKLATFEGTWVFGTSNFGDSLMYGKEVMVTPQKDGLKVRSSFNKTWLASPASDSSFFNLEYARRWRVVYDAQGRPDRIRWIRRGNKWWLTRKE